MQAKKTILITSVGSQVGAGILDSLQGRRSHLRVVGTNSVAGAAPVYACDTAHLVTAMADGDAFLRALGAVLDAERPDLIIPGRDDDVVFLSTLPETLGIDAATVLAGPAWLAGTLRDKNATASYAKAHGLPFADTIPCGELSSRDEALDLAARLGWPLVIKPATGDGSRDVWLVKQTTELDRWIGTPGYVIQPYLGANAALVEWLDGFSKGTPLHSSAPQVTQDVVQVLIGPQGDLLACFGMRTDMSAGRSWRVQRNPDPALLALGRLFGERLAQDGWKGPVNIQTRHDGKRHVPFEVNGRFNGTSSARTLLGFDEVGLILRHFIGVDPGPGRAGDTDMVLRQLSDKALADSAMADFRRDRVWHNPAAENDAVRPARSAHHCHA